MSFFKTDKKAYIFRRFFIVITMCCFFTSCGDNKNTSETDTEIGSDDTITIVFPDSVEKLSGFNEEQLCDYLEDNGDGNYSDIYIEDGQVNISLNEEQIEYWKNYLVGLIEEQEEILKEFCPKYSASCSESYEVIKVYCDPMLSFKKSFDYIGKTAIYCAMYQVFDGKDDYSLSLEVYNVDTGKLVVGGNMREEEVSYDETEWKESYKLDANEAAELVSTYDSNNVINIGPAFVDGMTIIDMVQTSGGTDYQYIYIDENGNVVLAVDDSQKNSMIVNMNKYLSSLKSQFEGLGDGYEISWTEDFSSIEYRFDANLSKQEQMNYFCYSETICMLNQLLKGDGESYYIDLSIYDSSTGELVSSGNTVDGITWNIGEE